VFRQGRGRYINSLGRQLADSHRKPRPGQWPTEPLPQHPARGKRPTPHTCLPEDV